MSKLQSGQASRVVIILAVVVLIMAALVYGITRYALSKKAAATPAASGPVPAVYDTSIGDVKFSFDSAKNFGTVLSGKASRFPAYQPDITTTEKFIKIVVKAQNTGKTDTTQYGWDLGNLIDAEGRIFPPINDKAYSWLPFPDLCGSVLKPGFEPTVCIRYYEVAKVSTSLKLEVIAPKPNSTKMQKQLMDINITK